MFKKFEAAEDSNTSSTLCTISCISDLIKQMHHQEYYFYNSKNMQVL